MIECDSSDNLCNIVESCLENGISSDLLHEYAPGLLIGVWKSQDKTHKSVWVESLGWANIELKIPMDFSHGIRVGSIAKILVGIVMSSLAREGMIDLESSACDYLPNIPPGITIRMLANMSSGIFNYVDDPGFLSQIDQNPDRIWEPLELLNIGLSYPLVSEPGTEFHYSNTNYIALDLIVEQISGRPLTDEIYQRVLVPMKLHHTATIDNPRIGACRGYMHGYNIGDQCQSLRDVTETDLSMLGAAGNMVSTIGDLRRMIYLLTEDSTLLEFMSREGTKTDFGSYGLGLACVRGIWYGHAGCVPGFESAVFRSPTLKTTVIILANVQKNTEVIYRQLLWPTGSWI